LAILEYTDCADLLIDRADRVVLTVLTLPTLTVPTATYSALFTGGDVQTVSQNWHVLIEDIPNVEMKAALALVTEGANVAISWNISKDIVAEDWDEAALGSVMAQDLMAFAFGHVTPSIHGRGLHSSTFRLNVITFCGKRRAASVSQRSDPEMAQVGQNSGRVYGPMKSVNEENGSC
jgi:hypothetical protein